MANTKLFQAAKHLRAQHVVLHHRLAARAQSLSRSGRGQEGEIAIVFRTLESSFC